MSVVWIIISFLVGLLVYLCLPLVLAPRLPGRMQFNMADHFYWLSAQALRRGGFVRRLHGGWDMVASSFDGEKTGEKVKLAGETRYFKDPYNFMSSFYNRPFWVAYEKYNAIWDPRFAELAEEWQAVVEEDDHKYQHVTEVEDENGEVVDALWTYYTRFLHLPGVTRVVEFAKNPAALPGGSRPEDAKTTEEWARASQSGFRDSRGWDYIQILTAYAVPIIVGWFVTNYGSTAAPNISGPTIPIVIGVLV